MRVVTLLLAAAVLTVTATGCVNYNTKLVNDKGQVANCSASGFGIIGSILTANSHEECTAKYSALGYK